MVSSGPMTTDAELAAAWSGGDPDAGEALIERHYDAVVRFFRTKTDVGAEDLVQRTFLVCAEKLGTYRGEAPFRAFVFGIARNVLFEHVRGRVRDGRADPALFERSVADLSPGVSTLVFRRAEERLLVTALQRIPLELQLVLELHYWEELGVDELASALAIPEGTVKSRLFRARAALRESLERLPASTADREDAHRLFASWAEGLRRERD